MNQCNHISFENEILNSDIPVVVIFTATWHLKCKNYISDLEDLSSKYKDKLKFFEMNVVNLVPNSFIINSYKIRSVPTLLFFRKNKLVRTHYGFLSKEDIVYFLDRMHLLAFL